MCAIGTNGSHDPHNYLLSKLSKALVGMYKSNNTEAVNTKKYLIENGVDSEDIILGPISDHIDTNTFSNYEISLGYIVRNLLQKFGNDDMTIDLEVFSVDFSSSENNRFNLMSHFDRAKFTAKSVLGGMSREFGIKINPTFHRVYTEFADKESTNQLTLESAPNWLLLNSIAWAVTYIKGIEKIRAEMLESRNESYGESPLRNLLVDVKSLKSDSRLFLNLHS